MVSGVKTAWRENETLVKSQIRGVEKGNIIGIDHRSGTIDELDNLFFCVNSAVLFDQGPAQVVFIFLQHDGKNIVAGFAVAPLAVVAQHERGVVEIDRKSPAEQGIGRHLCLKKEIAEIRRLFQFGHKDVAYLRRVRFKIGNKFNLGGRSNTCSFVATESQGDDRQEPEKAPYAGSGKSSFGILCMV